MHYDSTIKNYTSNNYVLLNAINSLLNKNNLKITSTSCNKEKIGDYQYIVPLENEKFISFSEEEVYKEINTLYGTTKIIDLTKIAKITIDGEEKCINELLIRMMKIIKKIM